MRNGHLLLLCSLLAVVLCSCIQTNNNANETDNNNAPEQTMTAIADDTESVTPNDTDNKTVINTDSDENGASLGVWWWNAGSAVLRSDREMYLDFLKENGVNEIYFCGGSFSSKTFDKIISSAEEYEMRVAYLAGDASWILEGVTGLDDCIEKFLSYQSTKEEGKGFYGMHLDIEPHQLPDFFERREEYIQMYCNTVLRASKILREKGYELEIDVPFWFDSEKDMVINENNEKENVISYLSRYTDTICIMSYRDKAEDILAISREEIGYAKASGCKIVFGVDTYSLEGDNVSFKEEGKKNMMKELEKLVSLLNGEELSAYGIAVHYLDTWYELKE